MLKRVDKLFNATLFIIALFFAGCAEKKPEDMVAEAKQSIQENDYKSAVVNLKAALQKEPNNTEARFLLAQSHHIQGEYAAAAKEYLKAGELGLSADKLMPAYGRLLLDTHQYKKVLDEIRVLPTLGDQERAVVHAYRAQAFLKLGSAGEASRELSEAERLVPQHPEIMIARSLVSITEGDLDGALGYTERAIRENPRHLDALLNKAAILALINKNDDALATYQEVVRIAPHAYEAHLAMARLHMMKQEIAEADAAIKRAEAIAPRSPKVMASRALLEVRRGNFSGAQQAINEVIKVIPDDPSTLLLSAITALAQSQLEQGRKSAERLLALQPGHPIATKVLGEIYLKTGQTEKGLETLAPLLKRDPQDISLLLLVAQVHAQQRNYASALEYLAKASAVVPGNYEVRLQRASILAAIGREQEAYAELEYLAASDSHDTRADAALIDLQIKRRQFDAALVSLERLQKKQPRSAAVHYLRGLALFGMNDVPAARAAMEQALSIDPTHIQATAILARLDLKENKPDKARRRYEAILTKDPRHVPAMLGMAEIAAQQRQEQLYRQWLERATQADPKAIEPRALLAQYHIQRREHSRAIAIAQEAVNNNPGSPAALKLLAQTQHASGEKEKALTTLMSLVKAAPDSAEAHYNLGVAQIAAGRSHEGRTSLQRALDLDRTYMPALDALIVLETAERRYDRALQLAKQIQQATSGDAIGYIREGDVHFARQQPAQAAQAYRQAIERGGTADVLIKLHRTLTQAGDARSAEQHLRAWLERRPDDVAVHIYAADQLFTQARYAEAIRHYEAVLQREPKHVTALNNLAELYRRNQDKRALNIAERAYRLAPERAEVLDTYGWLLVENGSLQQGLTLLRRAAEKSPGDLSIQYHLAVAHARSGDKATARSLIERSLATGRSFPERDEARALLGQL